MPDQFDPPTPVRPARPAGLDDLLGTVAAQLPDAVPAVASAPVAFPGETLRILTKRLNDPIAGLDAARYAAEALAHHARELAAMLRADTGEHGFGDYDYETGPGMRLAADRLAAHAARLGGQPLPAAEEQPAPARPARVLCAHGYGLMRDSCPGCHAEQETPHKADPVTVRPRWAKRDMRRCRRCAQVPSHRIHRQADR